MALIIAWLCTSPLVAQDPLPSWNDGPSKQRILQFVSDVTDANGEAYVEPHDRIATFDNDGTLWVEQPIYTQVQFALTRVRQLAPSHPSWKTEQPFKALLAGDLQQVASFGEEGLMKLVMASHANTTARQFKDDVTEWIGTAKHPRFDRLYTELVYLPQLELMKYLRANDFRVFIVSGGGIDFMRPWTLKTYGIPPNQVVGSSLALQFEMQDGKGVLKRLPKINFIDDKAGKPVGIGLHIGQRPILAFGNSDGDLEMLQYTTSGDGARLGLIVHHTDAVREYAYDRNSTVGRLDKALELAPKNDWQVVDMKNEWKQIFAWQ